MPHNGSVKTHPRGFPVRLFRVVIKEWSFKKLAPECPRMSSLSILPSREEKCGALSDLSFGPHMPAVAMNDALHGRQSNPSAGEFGLRV